jgi:hypothetical protein
MRLTIEQRKEKAIIDILNKQFKIIGLEKTYWDVHNVDKWYCQWTITNEQWNEWQDWGKRYLKRHFRNWSDNLCEREMQMIGLNWGFKFEESPEPNK